MQVYLLDNTLYCANIVTNHAIYFPVSKPRRGPLDSAAGTNYVLFAVPLERTPHVFERLYTILRISRVTETGRQHIMR
jgi:hypothetical protein